VDLGERVREARLPPGVAAVDGDLDRRDAARAAVGAPADEASTAVAVDGGLDLGDRDDLPGPLPAPLLPVAVGVLVQELDLGEPLDVDLAPVARDERPERKSVAPRQELAVHAVGQ